MPSPYILYTVIILYRIGIRSFFTKYLSEKIIVLINFIILFFGFILCISIGTYDRSIFEQQLVFFKINECPYNYYLLIVKKMYQAHNLRLNNICIQIYRFG